MCRYVQTIPILIVFLLILPLTWLRWFGYVNSNNCSKTSLLLLFLILLAAVFIHFWLNVCEKLGIVRAGRSCCLCTLNFKFFYLKVFYQLDLSIKLCVGLNHDDRYGLIASVVVFIGVAIDRDLYLGYGSIYPGYMV